MKSTDTRKQNTLRQEVPQYMRRRTVRQTLPGVCVRSSDGSPAMEALTIKKGAAYRKHQLDIF